jgi:hypothetical protein
VERQVWLAERRAALVAGYDAEAATYGDEEYPLGRAAGMGGPGAASDRARCDGAGWAVRDGQVLSDAGCGRCPGRGR